MTSLTPTPDSDSGPVAAFDATAAAAVDLEGDVVVDVDGILETALTTAVYDVHGVTDVFAAGGSIAQLPQIVGAVFARDLDRLNRVRVVSADDGTTVVTRIGVARSASTPEAARDVADALLAAVPEGDGATVSVQVSRIS